MKKHTHHKAYGDSTGKEPLIDLQSIKLWLNSFGNQGHSSEAVLNVLFTLGVILFVIYQVASLLHRMNKRVEKQLESRTKQRKVEVADKHVGDEMVFTDLHENVIRERMIPYRMPVINDDITLRNSQIFYEEMKMRRSCRQFSSRDVPLKVIQNLLKTAGTSPSVGNLQPWTFCVVSSDSIKTMIRKILEADERDNYVSRKKGASWVVDVSQLQDTWRRPYITDAPYLLIVCHEIFRDVHSKTERVFHYNQISTSIAVGILLAAIQNVGLSTVVTSPLNAGPDISRILRRPENESILLLLPLGYASEDVLVPDLKRKPVEHITKLY
ncbi:Iodotyrosine dehalogenase 1 homolog [Caenorhabditis elegans]|uniref:Iodotyrosine dehalogenase 1 homolog n=1 Tax=Caenorhabditis elegans TaxID=6239 RepID=IYD1H_CAEEL|nr:Iodotyrosine dehalogenase 1 homolog [Caenorhabditis elegans]P34273.3 RecName: Full=Iodotyrosine dehalogenase 1 homolog; Short=IYD-1 [Caenorhabditis elegans]AGC39147.1 SUP-18 [Caenorhabditis elegans]CCD62530.2 Iodotyrosine dehalogenase 1 homolog [Caenorhabditis elegans]|eukprot:NP_498712.3 Iodotyrosine dehalogenase 1 homolog [Caenorhabditis elegans]